MGSNPTPSAMNQICNYSVPLNGLGLTPATSSEPFEFSSVECISTATSTVEIVGALPQAFILYSSLFFGFVTFIFIVNYFKNR